jgi:hypothetical protein
MEHIKFVFLNVEQGGVCKIVAVAAMNPLTNSREWCRRRSHHILMTAEAAFKIRTGHFSTAVLRVTAVQCNPYSI